MLTFNLLKHPKVEGVIACTAMKSRRYWASTPPPRGVVASTVLSCFPLRRSHIVGKACLAPRPAQQPRGGVSCLYHHFAFFAFFGAEARSDMGLHYLINNKAQNQG